MDSKMTNKAADDEYLKNQTLELIKEEHSESAAFDKGLLLLNTGAIGASFLLLGNVFNKPIAESIVFLIGAWAAFTISSISNVTSHAASVRAFRIERELLQKRRLGEESPKPLFWEIWKWRWDIFAVNWLNRIGLFTFVIGAGLLLWFGYLNIQEISK